MQKYTNSRGLLRRLDGVESRRRVLRQALRALAGCALMTSISNAAFAAGKATRGHFYYQDTPDAASGRSCANCAYFAPKSTGLYGKESGDCALIKGDVYSHGYCEGWAPKPAQGDK